MNLHGLNGAPLNGASSTPYAQGAADLLAEALVSAAGTRVLPASATIQGSAEFAAINGTVLAGISVVIEGVALASAAPTHIVAASATVLAQSEVSAFIVRVIQADIQFIGEALVVAIPSAKLGEATIQGASDVSATANRVDPTPTAQAIGQSIIDPVACFATRAASAAPGVLCESVVVADTDTQLSGNGFYHRQGVVRATGQGNVVIDAVAVILLRQDAAFIGEAIVGAEARVQYQVAAAIVGWAEIEAFANRTAKASADVLADASIVATGVRLVRPTATLACEAIVTPLVTVRWAGFATPTGEAIPIVVGTLVQPGAANVIADCTVVSEGIRVAFAGATLVAEALIVARGESNTEAEDPPERMMRRPFVLREVRRPFVNREMKAPTA